MAWNSTPEGITPAQASAGFTFHAPQVPEGLVEMLARRNSIAPQIQQAFDAVTKVLQDRRRDQIANQLLAAEAPKATSVDGTQAGTGTPDTQLTAAMQAQNQRLGYSTEPSAGGMDTLMIANELQKRQADQQKAQQDALHQNLQNWNIGADIFKKTHPELAPAKPLSPTEARMEFQNTPEYLDWQQKNKAYNATAGQLNALTASHNLTIPDIPNIDTTTPNAVQFIATRTPTTGTGANEKQAALPAVDEQGNPVTAKGFEQKTVIPGLHLTEGEALSLIGQYGDKAGVVAKGTTTTGKPFSIPLQDYYKMLNLHHSLGEKPVMPTAPARVATGGTSGPPVGTTGTINGTPVVWDGHGWLAK